jgi:phenylacetate-CoA ligase
LSEERLLHYGRAINQARPSYIWAFAGVLYEIARTARDHGLRLHKPAFIISSGETLQDFMRSEIEDTFGCRVFNYYGSAEAGRVAGECRAGNLHAFEFSCHVEVINPSGEQSLPGEEGRLILTPLHNYAMPLIRYDTADIARVGPPECPCGCPLPTISRIAGRTVEFFVSRDGHLVSGGRIAQLMRHCRWAVGFQVLQRDIDQFSIFFKRAVDLAVSEANIEAVNDEIADVMGTDCRVVWEEVEEIPRTPNGKRPYARSLVWEGKQPVAFWESP